MRRAVISGRIAHFGQKYIPAEGEKSAFATAFVNVSMDRKDEETGYTETKPMKIIGNGWLAERMNNFAAGDQIYLEGRLEMERDYTNSEGELIKGGWIIRTDFIDNWGSQSTATATKPSAPHKGGATAPKKGAMPDKKVAPGKGIKMPQRAKKAEM